MAATPTMAAMFGTIAFVLVPVRDMARARAFYEDKLGLKVTANWQDQWIEYDIGTGTIAITAQYPGREPGARGALLAIEIADFDGLLDRLRVCGVPLVGEPWDTPVCRGATISDPDGNELLLHGQKKRS